MKRSIPWLMVWTRAALGPVMIAGAWARWPGWVLALLIVFALSDDIADGMLARYWSCDTPALRLADSCADTVFYVGVAVALWLCIPHLLRANAPALIVLFALEIFRYAFDFFKFGKPASYHSYLAKAWGLILSAAIVIVLVAGGPAWLFQAAILFGILTDLEGLTMSLVLPRWQNDVKTLATAWSLKAEASEQAAEEH